MFSYLKKEETSYLLKYMAVGVSGIFVNNGILFGLTESRLAPYYISAWFALGASFVSNYLLNDHWTFRDFPEGNTIKKFSTFSLVAIGGYLISYAILVSFTEVLHLWYILSNLIGIAVAFIWNYSMNRRLVWR